MVGLVDLWTIYDAKTNKQKVNEQVEFCKPDRFSRGKIISFPESVSLDQRLENESPGSSHFEITKVITEFCPSGFTVPASMAHA